MNSMFIQLTILIVTIVLTGLPVIIPALSAESRRGRRTIIPATVNAWGITVLATTVTFAVWDLPWVPKGELAITVLQITIALSSVLAVMAMWSAIAPYGRDMNDLMRRLNASAETANSMARYSGLTALGLMLVWMACAIVFGQSFVSAGDMSTTSALFTLAVINVALGNTVMFVGSMYCRYKLSCWENSIVFRSTR